ncbi:MAG TPA: SCO family protein [Anaerolineales bacterium]|nr:SCO family protein [Anaerolineales bacterium]
MDRKTLLIGIGSFVFLLAVGAAVLIFGPPASFRGTTYAEPYPIASEIDLARSDESRFRLSDLRGDIVLLFFGYTSCPDVCPATMAELQQALSELKEQDAKRVKVVFVTVDPERDTPERVQDYVDQFNPSFIGLSGSKTDLEKIWADYGVYREIADEQSAAGYIVNHTARVSLIDPQGNLRVSFSFDTPVEDIVHDLKLVLKNS